ncbi:MAG: hypothetical protein JWN99_3012 [Ilumatobacteraceae bacterium]|nr:hypothetical protein [Ilumatobacteraceae bacterium]
MSLISGVHAINKLFAEQDGLVTVAQLRENLISRSVIRHRVARGDWERIDERVIGATSTPKSWQRTVRAALLSAGNDAAVSDETAARLHDLDGFANAAGLHITTFDRRHHTPMAGVTLHRSRVLRADQCDEVNGIVCVSRPIVLVQIAATRGRDAAAKALDGMLRTGDSPTWIRQTVADWRRRGTTGPSVVLELLDERVDAVLPRSWFQRLAKAALETHGHVLIDEHPVIGRDGKLLAELDLAIPHLQVGVECQSWRWHAGQAARQRDAHRKRQLRLLGWELVEVWWSDLERIDEVLEELAFLIDRQRERQLAREAVSLGPLAGRLEIERHGTRPRGV